MGIELPAELAEVAAKAGVAWPQADEDALRSSAAAWRDAGAKLGTLAGESDGSATKALAAMSGATGDAARGHWNAFTAPDGRLDQVVRGCHAAADRLDHAARQVGAAKVEMVRELVDLAKNHDAATRAAAAGHPAALLGLDALVRAAAANVGHLASTLADAIRLDSGVEIGVGGNPVHANPGVHGPDGSGVPGEGAPGRGPGRSGEGSLVGDLLDGLLGGGEDGRSGGGLVGDLLSGGGPSGDGRGGDGQGGDGQGGDGPGGGSSGAGQDGEGEGQGGRGDQSGEGRSGGRGGGLLGAVLGGGGGDGGGGGGGLVGGVVGGVTDTVGAVVDPVLDTAGDVVHGAVEAVDRTVEGAADVIAPGRADHGPGHAPDPGQGSGHGQGHGPVHGPGSAPGHGNGPGPVGAPVVGGGPVHVGPVVETVGRAADTVTSSAAAVLDRPVLPVDAHAPAPQQPIAPAPGANGPQVPGFGGSGGPGGGVPSGPVGGAGGALGAGAVGAGASTGAPAQTGAVPGQSVPGQSVPGQSGAGQPGAAHQQATGQPSSGQQPQAAQQGGQRADQRGPGQLPLKEPGQPGGQPAQGNHSGQGNPSGQAKDAGQGAPAKDVAQAAKDAARPDAPAKSRDELAFGVAVLPLGAGRDTVVRGGPGQGAPPAQGITGVPGPGGTAHGPGGAGQGPAGAGQGLGGTGQGFHGVVGTGGVPSRGVRAAGSPFRSMSGVIGTGPGAVVPTELVGPPQRPARDARPTSEAAALLHLYMFPGGVLPPARSEPARQLPVPPGDRDFAPGLRFEPQGHPDGHLVDVSARERPRPRLGPPVEPDPALTDGYDPQAGMHERDWDRRFLVRLDPPEYAWPPAELFPEGGYEAGQPGVLAVGVELDRFGGPEGRVLSEAGTPFTNRSLPPAALAAGYHRYRVARELPVWFTLSAQWFGQTGGGVRYRTTHPVADLVALGHLEEIR
ncbi:glycohydrolase toxin TNT-related protein [Saccharothrix australiensis]|uniref:Uncharacterized protein DUF4237 n=1 Tax=Saccharothrix australiensis TaxID=2072 RepID=A0A495W8B3_9PSEU|nr:glycohydrolase toxin TNT-related protein [Saccharothrix australiensis]RKT57524.1 uncharacterized protein DUF4237 [Saccharothrix australiensis]